MLPSLTIDETIPAMLTASEGARNMMLYFILPLGNYPGIRIPDKITRLGQGSRYDFSVNMPNLVEMRRIQHAAIKGRRQIDVLWHAAAEVSMRHKGEAEELTAAGWELLPDSVAISMLHKTWDVTASEDGGPDAIVMKRRELQQPVYASNPTLHLSTWSPPYHAHWYYDAAYSPEQRRHSVWKRTNEVPPDYDMTDSEDDGYESQQM